mmetsp:Transcript_14488/g.23991  ORF Transcript_14488/g.23991 Transcript_14488/m.23991 type:complete len:880 (+) Transcript_14488:183-2822(+)
MSAHRRVVPPRRPSHDESLMGLNVANIDFEGSVSGSVGSRGSRGGRDDLSLAYSIDDHQSRASTYISAASEDEEDKSFTQAYYHPALPTPAENPAPPPPPPEPEEPTAFESFIAHPIDYIFGGNDDDVSTLGGFGESFRWGDGDASTIATTPTLTQEFMQQQPTIYEDEEEDRASSSRSSSYHSKSQSGDGGASVRFNTEDEEYTYGGDEDEYTYGEVEEASLSQGGEGDLYNPKKGGSYSGSRSQASIYSRDEEASQGTYESAGLAKSIISSDNEDSYAGEKSYAAKFTRSSFSSGQEGSYSSRQGGSMTDEDASRSRYSKDASHASYEDEASITLSVIAADMPKRRPPQEPWNEDDSASVHSSRSSMWRRNVANNKSWRSTKSMDARNRGLADSRSVYSMSGRSTYSMANSVMPETPEVIVSSHGGPTMTMGMSGRAVVHVKMEHANDGTIENLSYTTPLVDALPGESARDDYMEQFNDEDTVTAGNKDHVPWYGYYHARSSFIRQCHTRQCYRVNVMLLVGLALILTITISVSTVVSSADSAGGSATTTRNTADMNTISLNDLTAPAPISGITLPDVLDANLKDWFTEDGNNAAHRDDVPYYFHIPLAGAMIAHESWAHCLGFTIASAGGKASISNTTLTSTLVRGASFVNVDLSNPSGIEHAARMDLVPSGIPDVIISPLFGDIVSNLYSHKHRNKFMITMRHPIDRAVALFEFKKSATSEPNYDPALTDMTLEQYALSGHIESNYVTRLLTMKYSGSLTSEDLDFCKELLRRKAVVGIYEKMEATLTHFERYFGWTPVATDAVDCQAKLVQDGVATESVIQLDAGSSAFALIKQQNMFDIALYDYTHNVLVPYQNEVIERQIQMSLGGGGNIIA